MKTNWQQMAWMTIALILLACAPVAFAQSAKQQTETVSQSWAQLIAASQDYRASLARVLELQMQEQARAAELVEKQKLLFAQGSSSKRELEVGEQAFQAAQTRTNEVRQQLEEVDQLIAEASATESLVKQPAEAPNNIRSPRRLLHRENAPSESKGNYRNALIRYAGTSAWALSDFAKVDAFFRAQFGKPLAVSAFGESATHNRLGFDHRAAIDVAVHPDSNEGQTLIEYLRKQGIPFIAIRCAIPGSATGAHIHIGPPSKRAAVP